MLAGILTKKYLFNGLLNFDDVIYDFSVIETPLCAI